MTSETPKTMDEAVANVKEAVDDCRDTVLEGLSKIKDLMFKHLAAEYDEALDRIKELEAEVIALKANQRPTNLSEAKLCNCPKPISQGGS